MQNRPYFLAKGVFHQRSEDKKSLIEIEGGVVNLRREIVMECLTNLFTYEKAFILNDDSRSCYDSMQERRKTECEP